MCTEFGWLNLRGLRQRKLTLALVSLLLVIMGIAVLMEAQTNAYLIETYKKLDKKDFNIQASATALKDVKESVGQIYYGTQLDKATAYFDQLKAKGLNLKLDSVKYNEIKVLKHNLSSAILLVDSNYSGKFVNAEKEEVMRKLAVDTLCQVELARDGNEWKIADVVVLEEQ